jgi:hypothetical protein
MIVGLTSALVVAIAMLCVRIASIGSTRPAWKVRIDGFLLRSLVGPLQRVRGGVEGLISFVLGVVESLRNHLASHGRGGAGNV